MHLMLAKLDDVDTFFGSRNKIQNVNVVAFDKSSKPGKLMIE